MVQYDKMVLNHLLNTYENSLLSTGENKRTIQIEFRFTKAAIAAYFDESSAEYEKIHILMKALEDRKLVRIIWRDNKKDYMIQKIRLQTEHLEEAYRYVGRRPRRGLEQENVMLLEKYLDEEAPVTVNFVRFLLERLQNHRSVKEYLTLEDYAETDKFLQACVFVEQNRTPCYIREFSIKYFRDSKYFEQIESRIVKVFRQFADGYAEMDATELLSEYGIYHTPNYVYFKGNVHLRIEGEEMDVSLLKQGLGISGEDIENIRFTDMGGIKKVITIENLTSFFRYREENSLLVYLGGYHNKVRRILLQKIREAAPKAAYFHFGDIDAGGISILLDLRKKTGIPFQSYYMDKATLTKYSLYGKSLTESDRKRLERLFSEEEFREVIRYMLEKNVKLEQECVIL